MSKYKEHKEKVKDFFIATIPLEEQEIIKRVKAECLGYKKFGFETYASIIDYMKMDKLNRIAYLTNIENEAKNIKDNIIKRRELEKVRFEKMLKTNALKNRVMSRILEPLKKKMLVAEFLYGIKSDKACELRSMYYHQVRRSTTELQISMAWYFPIINLQDLLDECHDIKLAKAAAERTTECLKINDYDCICDEINFANKTKQKYEVSYILNDGQRYCIGYFRCKIASCGISLRYSYYYTSEPPVRKYDLFHMDDNNATDIDFTDYVAADKYISEKRTELFSGVYNKLCK